MKTLQSFVDHVPMLIASLVVIIATYFVNKLVAKVLVHALNRIKMRYSLIEVFKKLLSVTFWIAGILIASVIVVPSLTFADLFTAVGLGTVAIGFAFKDIFENFLAGILILVRDTFLIDDYIEGEGYEGRVEQITIRDTHIRRSDGERVVVPNAHLFKNPVTVVTDLELRRTTIICGISYNHDVNEVAQIIKQTVEKVETVSNDRPIEIFANKLSESSIDYEVTWWTKPAPRHIRNSRHQVIAAITKALKLAKVEIPFPHRTITFENALALNKQQ